MAKWEVIGASERGASHRRNGMPNQDAWTCDKGAGGVPIIVAVADGHGSARAFRSDKGAWLAVRVALDVAYPLLEGKRKADDVRMALVDRFPRELVKNWLEAVEGEARSVPFTSDEAAKVAAAGSATSSGATKAYPVSAYGTTLLVALITDQFMAFVQNGDGDILVVDTDGTVHRPMAEDVRLIGNETTSLSSPEAWRDFRTSFLRLRGDPPALVMLSTDGYANSFVSAAAFEKVATDIADIVRDEGVNAIQNNLQKWLANATEAGSGDDITVALICRTDLPPRHRPAPISDATEAPDLEGLS